MKNTIIFLIILVAGLVLLGWYGAGDQADDLTLDEAALIAEEWIVENSPTYLFDGSDLSFVSGQEIGENRFSLVFEFESAQAGFGDRTDQMVAQVITPHTVVVIVDQGQVVEAVTDEQFSEIDGLILDEMDSETVSVEVYFLRVVDGTEEIVALDREVDGQNIERGALEQLLSGLTLQEFEDGHITAINEGVEILSFNVENGVATIDFNSRLDEGVAGSATVLAITNQINQTLTQFETIDEVVIMVEGESDEILQP